MLAQTTKILGHYYKQGVQTVSLGPHSIPGPIIHFVTITRNPKSQESCSPKLKEERCCRLVLLNSMAHLGISCLILLTGLEHLFTFPLDSLALFPWTAWCLPLLIRLELLRKREDRNTMLPICVSQRVQVKRNGNLKNKHLINSSKLW